MLLTPVIILNTVKLTAVMIALFFLTPAILITTITLNSKARMAEVFIAGTINATVLNIFLSSTSKRQVIARSARL